MSSHDPDLPEDPDNFYWQLLPPDMEDLSNPFQCPADDYFRLPSPLKMFEEEGDHGDGGFDPRLNQPALQPVTAPVDTQWCHGLPVDQLGASTGMFASSAVPVSPPVALTTAPSLGQTDAQGTAIASSEPPIDPSSRADVVPALPSTDVVPALPSTNVELGGDNPIPENIDPAQAKLLRRRRSNRESARRSRKRKRDQINALGVQLGQLKEEKSNLLEHCNYISTRRDVAVANNRILRADVATMKAKVELIEARVRNLTNMNPGILAKFRAANLSMSRARMEASTTATVHSQQTWNGFPASQIPSVATAVPCHYGLDGRYWTNNFPAPLERNQSNNVAWVEGMRNVATTEDMPGRSNFPPGDVF